LAFVVCSINNFDTRPTPKPIRRSLGAIEPRIPRLELSYNVYYLSLKAFTESGAPDWGDPADVHNQLYQVNVITEGVIHGLMRFDAEWRQPAETSTAAP
jgi:endo-1,4-beta-D-glucanase Y